MSRNTNNSELPKNSGSEYNTNEKLKINNSKISEMKAELLLLYSDLEIEEARITYIAIHNRLATLHGLLQLEHLKLRDLYNSNLSK